MGDYNYLSMWLKDKGFMVKKKWRFHFNGSEIINWFRSKNEKDADKGSE